MPLGIFSKKETLLGKQVASKLKGQILKKRVL